MRVVLDLEQYHKMGSHCLTTCFVTLFRQKGVDMPEEVSLGLGSGLGFTYVRQKEGFIFGGRGGNLEQNLAAALGCEIVSNKTENRECAWQYNRKLLEVGNPLICDVDMAYLPYMVEKLKTNGSGFSGHKLILFGFDDEKNETYVLDYLWNNIIIVNTDDFKSAASSSTKPISPDNSSIYFQIPEELYPLEHSINSAIGYNVNQMRSPVGIGLGLKAIKRFYRELRNWPDILNEHALRYELNMAYFVFEKIGTGGGNFRRMYSRFLKFCAAKLKDENLMEVCRIYGVLGKLWKIVAFDLYNTSIDPNILNNKIFMRKYDIGDQILKLETEGIEQLERYIGGKKNAFYQ